MMLPKSSAPVQRDQNAMQRAGQQLSEQHISQGATPSGSCGCPNQCIGLCVFGNCLGVCV